MICALIYTTYASLVQWLEYAVANGVARVRFPDDAYIFYRIHTYIHTPDNNNNNMLDPGFEPGLPRPQRGVLTSRLIQRIDRRILTMEVPGFDPGASRLQSARSSN